MKRMNPPFARLGLVALLLMLGSGLASATEPVAMPQAGATVVAAPQPVEAQPAARPETIRLAWDRVGAMA